MEWVPRPRLIVPWAEVEAFLDDEERFEKVEDASGGVWFGVVRWWAMDYAFLGAPEGEFVVGDDGSASQGVTSAKVPKSAGAVVAHVAFDIQAQTGLIGMR